ncbi:hypothetical protein K503DRAFT_869083 [Rhizopogon vinicolor AM-OR11-026]|uniref:Up-regulated during septation protein 1 domain-containing protein n=1 Tax=Rhizopogon vinicolor AM-OR11-026 TaxID=1314800 RepID=A0A1B7MNL6_9AGAM|nr:hypothetical protein K503DRAFT_869083 [Rhizopogon vinicolor AM-OR11-026]
MRKLWGGGSSSANSQPLQPPPQPEKPSSLVSFIKTGKPTWPSGESTPASPTTPGLFIKKNRKQSSVVSLTESGGNVNGNQSRRSDSLASPPISPTQSAGPLSPPKRKPVPSSTPSNPPVAGPSSSANSLPTSLPPRNSAPSEWNGTSGLFNVRDDLLMSLLTSEAVIDSRECEILSGEEIEELKKEYQVLKTRLAATQRKLKLETKLRDAALSLSKLNTAHNKVPKAADDQLEAAERRVNVAQTELWRVSERASEVERRLLEHRAGVLGYSVTKMEKKTMPSEDTSGPNTPNRVSALSSVTTASASSKRFDGAHLFAGHANAQIPKAPPTAADVVSLEDKLRTATEALSAANQNIAALNAELEEAREQWQAEKAMMEEDKLAELGALCDELHDARDGWVAKKAMMEENKLAELGALRDELEDAREHWEAERVAMEDNKLAELDALRDELEDAKEHWEAEKVAIKEKLAKLDALQDELEDARAGGETRAELDEAMEALRMVVQLHGIEAPPDSSLQDLLSSVRSHLEHLSAALQEHSDRHATLEDELQVHREKNKTLSKDLNAVRQESDNARLEILSLESRIQELADKASSVNNIPPVEYKGEVADIISLLQPIWPILPAPELRTAKFSSTRHLRNNSGPLTPGTSPTRSALPSLSDMDVRGLKSLYDIRSRPATPLAEQGRSMFTVEAFVARVEALIVDDRALIERLIHLAQAHDLLKKNAERAQKLAQSSNAALETYQRQVTTLESQNISLVAKQSALMDEIRELQDAVERAVDEKREMEMHAGDQAEMCRQLTEANNALSAKTLTLAEEAATAPEMVRKQLEGQLAECTEALRKAHEEIEAMRTSEQTQRIALLDELNSMQTENGNLRAQLRAVKK